MSWRERIVATADTLAGKPRIRNTRISVELILDCLVSGWTVEEILAAYPHISHDDVLAALAFATEFLKQEWGSTRGKGPARLSVMQPAETEGLNAGHHTHFIVEEMPDGSYVARAIGADIVTEACDIPTLHSNVRDAVRCHFDEDKRGTVSEIIWLHYTREEAIAA